MSIRPLSEELQKKAQDELNENPQRRIDDIQYIKDWLTKEPHLNVNADDQLILSFLRGCKFSYEKTKKKLDSYYTTRTLIPEIFSNRDPLLPEIQSYLKAGLYWVPLPKYEDPLAPRILYGINIPNAELVDPILIMKVIQMVMDILLHEDDSFVINGFHVIMHMREFSLHNLKQFSPNLLKKLIVCVNKRYPTRVKGYHCLDASSAFHTFFNICKGLLSKKIISRNFLYQSDNINELHNVIPKLSLPIELGGEIYNIHDILDEWKKKIESYRDWFLTDEKYRSEEWKRIGKSNKDTEFFEIEGSFKKLEID